MANETLIRLAREAIAVQDACNLSGVVHSFSKAVVDLQVALRAEPHKLSTETINHHPIAQMWCAKLIELSGMGFADQGQFGKAYREVQKLAAGDLNQL